MQCIDRCLYGSKADVRCITSCPLSPNSDRESGHRQTVMSALPPKADMCSARAYVRFGPKADMRRYSTISSAIDRTPDGMVSPSALAVLRLIARLNLMGSSTGISAGLAPRMILST